MKLKKLLGWMLAFLFFPIDTGIVNMIEENPTIIKHLSPFYSGVVIGFGIDIVLVVIIYFLVLIFWLIY